MPTIEEVCQFLESFAPTRLAEEWDNVGLLVGDPEIEAQRIMTCLTVTPQSAAEAIDQNVNLIVSHHPLPFRPLKRLTTESVPSRMLWDLIRAGISIYSPHTGFDSASNGINQMLTECLELTNVQPLVPIADDPDSLGAGRVGDANPQTVGTMIGHLKDQFQIPQLPFVGDLTSTIHRVGVACGSGGSFLSHARAAECDAFVTGEATFHTCLEAQACGIAMILLGHYASERFALQVLAAELDRAFPGCQIWASKKESDPINWS